MILKSNNDSTRNIHDNILDVNNNNNNPSNNNNKIKLVVNNSKQDMKDFVIKNSKKNS